MIVVSNTTPLNYLVLIGEAEILPQLYERVIIPPAVFAELQRVNTPAVVKHWITNPPQWLEVQPMSSGPDPGPAALDEGEREALALAELLRAGLLLMDDRQGRREAARRGVRVIGTLGVLAEAASRGIINLPATISRLRQTNFYVRPELLQALLDRFKVNAKPPD